MTSTYLTVAIPYVNAAPHLGYAYELVLADIAARARRSRPGGEVRFLEPILPRLAARLARQLTPVAGKLPSLGPAYRRIEL